MLAELAVPAVPAVGRRLAEAECLLVSPLAGPPGVSAHVRPPVLFLLTRNSALTSYLLVCSPPPPAGRAAPPRGPAGLARVWLARGRERVLEAARSRCGTFSSW